MKYSVKEVKTFGGPGAGWERFFLKKLTQNWIEKPFSDSFLKYQNGTYRWSKLL